jgi:molecular chaperone DnaJ
MWSSTCGRIPSFSGAGDDIYCDMPVPFHVAALGGEIEVPTLHGFAKLKVSAGTESGTVLRIKGKGVTALQGYGAGDQHVRLRIEVPDRLDREQKDWLRRLADSSREDQYPGLREVRRQAEEFYAHKAAMKKDS